jgi:ribosomal protein S18 acetylase RimI-like enzyme
VTPSDVRVRRARTGEEPEVARFEAAFDFPVRAGETRRFLEDERHHLILGYLDERPAGFVSAVEMFHPDKRPELFLNEIGVAEDARRHGVARALIEELKVVGFERGCTAIWVLTDEGNEAAMAMYRGSGARWDGDRIVMFGYDLDDPLRDPRTDPPDPRP